MGKTQSNSKEDAYLDRNLAVLALAKLARMQGYTMGIQHDPKTPDWPILYIDLPTGQVSYHLPKDLIEGEWDEYVDGWDGHDLEEKRRRISDFICT